MKFKNANKLCIYLGITPTISASGRFFFKSGIDFFRQEVILSEDYNALHTDLINTSELSII